MRTDTRAMLAVGVLGVGSQIGKRIEGLLRRGGTFTTRVSMSTAIVSVAALGGLMIAGSMMPRWIAFAQEGRPAFKAASIRPSKCQGADLRGITLDDLWSNCTGVRNLIETAYTGRLDLLRPHVLGGPAWIDTDPYEIKAKATRANPQSERSGPMMQRLLKDRFGLRFHRETRTVPVYELTVASGGPTMQASKPGECLPVDPANPPALVQPPDHLCGVSFNAAGRAEMEGVTMADLSRFVSGMMDRSVVDRTGISGRFDLAVTFQIAPGASPFGIPPPGPGAMRAHALLRQRRYEGMIAPAVEQQLGLRLVPASGPEEFIIIDRIERPSPD